MSKSDQPKFSQKAPIFISKSKAENLPRKTQRKSAPPFCIKNSKKEKL
jgi:hypothetical protein